MRQINVSEGINYKVGIEALRTIFFDVYFKFEQKGNKLRTCIAIDDSFDDVDDGVFDIKGKILDKVFFQTDIDVVVALVLVEKKGKNILMGKKIRLIANDNSFNCFVEDEFRKTINSDFDVFVIDNNFIFYETLKGKKCLYSVAKKKEIVLDNNLNFIQLTKVNCVGKGKIEMIFLDENYKKIKISVTISPDYLGMSDIYFRGNVILEFIDCNGIEHVLMLKLLDNTSCSIFGYEELITKVLAYINNHNQNVSNNLDVKKKELK